MLLKNPSMAHQHSYAAESDNLIPPHPLNLKTPLQPKDNKMGQQEQEDKKNSGKFNKKVGIALDKTEGFDNEEEDSGREKLKRHRVEVAGRVWIPDIWGQEELLKDWIDCTAFDAPLVPSRIVMARAALVEEGRRATSTGLRIGNRC
ncbi:hypothetical protein RJT34_23698 [Clitoria ternatea]|uniref:Uncharacterized protein n=1 Tax=Clitoria ternatea TaxID=43366 RepID=A0AAN9IF74_CLITE